MLVLSRKLNEKVLFPGTEIAVQVVSVRPGVVRLGIDAPSEVKVVRAELHDATEAAKAPAERPGAGLPRELAHQLRNRVNAATLATALLRRQQQLGLTQEAESTLEMLDREIKALRGSLDALPSPARPLPTPRPNRRRKALLVEDDANERELLAGLLRLAGLEVMTAADGIEALERLRAPEPPAVVLLDMVLPRCDGPTTVREIRRNPAQAGLKVFAVSGHPPERFAAGGAPGVDRWFRKPINPEELLRELDHELAGVA